MTPESSTLLARVQVLTGIELMSTWSGERHSNQRASKPDTTLLKKKIKLSSYIRKFRMEQLQSHIWLTASSYMRKYLHISSYTRKPFLIYDFATAPLWISYIYEESLISFFSSVVRSLARFCTHLTSGEVGSWGTRAGSATASGTILANKFFNRKISNLSKIYRRVQQR